jgi:hypothetical protein
MCHAYTTKNTTDSFLEIYSTNASFIIHLLRDENIDKIKYCNLQQLPQ